jgi:hypothetical protein
VPQGPAARITDNVVHPLPPVLLPGPGSLTVLIGFLPTWRGMPLTGVAALQAAKPDTDIAIKTAESATVAAAGTPGAPAAYAAEQATKASVLGSSNCRQLISGHKFALERHFDEDGSWVAYQLNAMRVNITATTDLTFKCGAGQININAAGIVTIQGVMIKLN